MSVVWLSDHLERAELAGSAGEEHTLPPARDTLARMDLLSHIHRLRLHIGRRGAIIGFMGTIALIIGLGSIGQPPPEQGLINAQFLVQLLPLQFWYGVWTVVGMICLTATFWKKMEVAAVGSFSFVCGVFSLGYFAAEIFGEGPVSRAWAPGILYGGFSVVMLVVAGWPEKQLIVELEESR